MNKFVGELRGDGEKQMWSFTHNLGTFNFVFNIRSGYKNEIMAGVTITDENTVVVNFREPLDVGENLTITMIG